MEKLQANFNFGGCYNSNHDWVIDNYIDTFIRDRETDELPENEGEIYDAINYKGLRNLYCKELVKFMNSKLNINLEYLELDSPAYYNFTTDKIVVNFDENDFKRISNYLKKCQTITIAEVREDIKELLKDWTTQRDGFIPFYSYSEIKDNLDWKMEAVLQLFAQECFNTDSDFWLEWYDLIDDLLYRVGAEYGIGSIEPIYENDEE